MKPHDEAYCLVLSGGGAKGVYHIGVWRALRELGIRVDAFIGVSIGALIAALLAQGAEKELEEIGRKITVDSILALPEEFTEDGIVKIDRDSFSAAKELFDSLRKNKGFDTSPLRRLLAARIDEAKIRKSGNDLGIVAVNLSDLEPCEVFLEGIEEGSLVDYLMASAAFPGFEQSLIDGKKYVDGGIYDNIPYSMARKRGLRRIIVSDISGLGRNRKIEIAGSLTVYIKNSIEMGGVLDFRRDFLDKFTILGYLDAMRAFGRLKGYSYFLEPNRKAEAAFADHEPATRKPLPAFPDDMRHDRDLLLKSLECAASILEVERIKAYSYESLAEAIHAKKDSEEARVAEFLANYKGDEAGIVKKLRDGLSERLFDGSAYYYWRLVEEFLPKTAGSLLRRALVDRSPGIPAGLEYLKRIGER